MNPYLALGIGAFVGVIIGFRVGCQFMFEQDSKEYLRGYKEGLEWTKRYFPSSPAGR